MPVTTVLKVLKGWRYVKIVVSNWFIAVFAFLTVFTMVSTGPGMGSTFDTLFSVS